MAITIRPWGKARPLAPDVPPPHAPEVDVIKLIVSDPLGFMDREYDRLRLGTGLIHRLAKMSSVDKPLAQSLLNFLRFQIPLRFEDQADDLFPLVALRARKDDDVARMLGRLSDSHAAVRARLVALLPRLDADWSHGEGAPALMVELVALSTEIQQHMALVNAVILPIARLRLTAQDVTTLSQSMIERRGKR